MVVVDLGAPGLAIAAVVARRRDCELICAVDIRPEPADVELRSLVEAAPPVRVV